MRNFSLCTILIALLAVQPVCAQEIATIPLQTPAAVTPPPASNPNVLAKGTMIRFVLLDSISSETAQKGQTVHFALAQDIEVNGTVVIPRGTEAEGQVTHVRKGIPDKQDGELTLEPRAILLNNGTKLKLQRHPPGEDACGDMGPCAAMVTFGIILLPCVAAVLIIDSPWLIHSWIHDGKTPKTNPQIDGDNKTWHPCEIESAYTKTKLTAPFFLAQSAPDIQTPIGEQLASCPTH
jgi:hypothetical protein